MLSIQALASYWTGAVLEANFLVLLHLLGALALGLLVGYERTYHGRAAGMRTYGLVCMATAALTVIGGYSHYWYGGTPAPAFSNADVSRVIQGILTGIGFLCAGVIMREGFNISGLTTAASLWSAAIIGVLVGAGMFAAAIALALLCTMCMVWMSKLESRLPSRQAVAVRLIFAPHIVPKQHELAAMANQQGYSIATGTIAIGLDAGVHTWNFIAVAHNRNATGPLSEFSAKLEQFPGVQGLHIGYARN